VIDIRNVSPFVSFLALPQLLQLRAFVDPYRRKGKSQWPAVAKNFRF